MTSIDDLDLPRSILNRVIKNSLPEGAQVQKEAKAAMTKACTVFINYLTAAALDVTKQNDRKSLNANDILKALTILEFDAFLPTVKGAVEDFQLRIKTKRQEYKRNFKEKQRTTDSAGEGAADTDKLANATGDVADEEGGVLQSREDDEQDEMDTEMDQAESQDIPHKRKPVSSHQSSVNSIKRARVDGEEGEGAHSGSEI